MFFINLFIVQECVYRLHYFKQIMTERKGFFIGSPVKGETAPFSTGTKEEIAGYIKKLKDRGINTLLDSFEYSIF